MAALAAVCVLLTGGALMANAQPNGSTARAGEAAGCEGVDFANHVAYCAADATELAGTTMNLFDYWATTDENGGSASWAENRADSNAAINAGHQLIFRKGNDAKYEGNKYTGSAETRPGIVQDTLAEDGYPTLQTGTANGYTEAQSLAYLFNSSEQAGKRAYMDVKGLMQLDANGYYSYDSTKNFASFDTTKNAFNLYDAASVGQKDSDVMGMFFPFNTGSQVFDETNGSLTPKKNAEGETIVSNGTNWDLNHFLGVNMSTEFVQPTNGFTDGKSKPMTYEFSGDDDVWVFIDGVLVGDLGGIHDAASLKIDFHTGQVIINQDKTKNDVNNYWNLQQAQAAGYKNDQCELYTTADGRTAYTCTRSVSIQTTATLKQLFESAGKTDAGFQKTSDGNYIFADGSYHTLDFFYLERGHTASNMKLKFNLVAPKSSDIIKVDQNGDSLNGAKFKLYTGKLGEDDKVVKADERALATGTTKNGKLVLEYAENNPDGETAGHTLDFHKRLGDGKANSTYYVLEETEAPAGYSRMINPMLLKYESAADSTSGSLTSYPDSHNPNSSVWNTGGVARSKETLTAPINFKTDSGKCASGCVTEDALVDGFMFAVVLKKGDSSDGMGWQTITGNTVEGWNAQTITGIQSIIDAYKKNPHVFKLVSGRYSADIDELPGYLSEYYFQMKDTDRDTKAKYTVAVYYSTAKGNEPMNRSNTWRLSDTGNDNFNGLENFERTFSSRFTIPNIKNELYVQKVDKDSNPLEGATFSLYTKDQVNANNYETDGTVTPNTDTSGKAVEPYDSVTTGNQWCVTGWNADEACSDGDSSTPSFAGAAAFGLKATVNGKEQAGFSGKALTNGTYYLVEATAPDGYALNTKATKVIVTDEGIFADAGNDSDDVKVIRGVGQLVATMSTFGSTGSFDDTLRYVKTYPGNVTVNGDKIGAGVAASLLPGKAENGKVITSSETKDPLHLRYGGPNGKSGAALDYGPRNTNGDYLFVADSGWPVLRTYQDSRPDDVTETQERTELSNSTSTDPSKSEGSLSSLITGSVMVQVTNQKAAATTTISLTKKVEGAAWNRPDGKDFEFTLQRVDKNDNGTTTANNGNDGKVTYQSKDADKTPMTVNVGSVIASTKTEIAKDETKTVSFPELSFAIPTDADSATYTFTVTENDTDNPPTGWTFDKSEYEVTVTVSKDENGKWTAVTKVMQTKDAAGKPLDPTDPSTVDTPLFVNSFQKIENLPLTGALGLDRNWLILGGGITLLGLAFALIANRLKRGE